ncbi:hypothetical protein [Salinicoccus albus]|uniref:hypothetical protein n=1 Tax=Salinicoccus albus TaxID=418756 RepID=UPI000374DED1|nr:hypothetical protein [Salinicoccus albus]
MERNTDVCVVMDMDETRGTLTVYSPVNNENIIVPVTDDILSDVMTDDGVAFEVDLDTKEIV